MNTTEQKLTELIKYQKQANKYQRQTIENQRQLLDVINYNFYQHAIDDFFYPAEKQNIRLKADLQILRAELLEDSKSNPPFVNATISKYNDKLTEMLNYYITEGQTLGRPYPHLGKKQIKNSFKIITGLESVKNKMTVTIKKTTIEKEELKELTDAIDKIDKLLSENVATSKEIIEDMSKKMIAINTRLSRDYSKYSITK